MQPQNWTMGRWMTSALLILFGMLMSVSGQCFSDNDRKPCGMMGSSGGNEITNGSIDFAVDLFKSVAKAPSLPNSGNCVISPDSVRFALILTYLGTREVTKSQLQTVLRLGNASQKQVLQKYRAYKSSVAHNATDTVNYTVNIADRIYFDKGLFLRQCMVNYLTPELEQLDFRTSPEPSRQIMNKWVEDQTNKRIVGLFPEGSITSDTDMTIVNAVYLKAAWAKVFEARSTSDQDFFVDPQTSKKVSTMHQTWRTTYGRSSQLGCTAVELPYSGNEISMVFLLPDNDAPELINKLNSKDLRDLLNSLSSVSVGLSIPKFKFNQPFELTGNLRDLGIQDLLDKSKADLSGFTGSKNAYVSAVHHKVFIEVNEGGTEAAAATGVVISPTSIIVVDKEFNCNRPFVFLIRTKKTNSVLFIGLVKDPTVGN